VLYIVFIIKQTKLKISKNQMKK